MTPTAQPLLYVILGATGSGRREVVADVIEAGLVLDPAARAVCLLSASEPVAPEEARLGEVLRWQWEGDRIEGGVPEHATHVFFFTDGQANPVDQLEALKPWMNQVDSSLARIICVVNCRLAEAHPTMLTWYDACIHFSDFVLLHRREGVGNKWMSDFRARYEAQFLPALFEMVKEGRVKNPALLLEPQARRISHYFDEGVEWLVDGQAEDAEEDETIEEGDQEVTATQVVDPYFERRAGGRRAKEIPDVRTFLAQS